ncbi:MAG: carboxypeptidase-like regulatory domain-containing protein, partial [Myxococcota bacterium]|nr:carboxypeptidase-like regulatory domain-containing protein [Myxococcota bacterium]
MVGSVLVAWLGRAAAATLTVGVSGATGTAIPAAEVLAINAQLEAIRATTDDEGLARFDLIPSGVYRVRVTPADGDPHTPQYFPNALTHCDGARVEVGGEAVHLDMELVEGASVEGVLLDANGDGVVGARVRAESITSNARRDAWSNANGAFVIGGLQHGEQWRIQAAISGFPVQWWGGTTEQTESPPVNPADSPPLEPWILLSGASVTGTVSSPSGPVGAARVRVYSTGQVTQVTTDADGTFIATGIPIGSMTAWATAAELAVTYLGDSDRPERFIDLPEEGHHEPDVNIAMPLESTLTVQLSGDAPLSDGSLHGLSVVLYNDDRTVGRGEQTRADGTAEFSGLHGGTYSVYVYGAAAGHADDWLRDEAGAIQSVIVAPESTNGPVPIPLGKAHTVHGTVVDEWGQPIRGASVVISERMDDDTGESEPGGLFVESTNRDGDFIAAGIPYGQWNIRVQTDPVCPSDPGHVSVHLPNEVDPLMAEQ